MTTTDRPLPPSCFPPIEASSANSAVVGDTAAVGGGIGGVGDDGWRIAVVTPDEAGCKFYLQVLQAGGVTGQT